MRLLCGYPPLSLAAISLSGGPPPIQGVGGEAPGSVLLLEDAIQQRLPRGDQRVTAIFAATIALVQDDLKRVLAYSTVSQLGFMMVGLGVGS